LSHGTPVAQDGAQEGAAQKPLAQTSDAQSKSSPHALPSSQVGEHEGGPQIPLLAQTFEPQSALLPHALPLLHVGEQAGAAHAPSWQTPDAQSVSSPQGLLSAQVGEHVGGPQTPLFAHTFEPQSPLAPQRLPLPHVGEQTGTWHVTLHTSERQSEALLQAAFTPQLPVQPVAAVQRPLWQLFEAQSGLATHEAPRVQEAPVHAAGWHCPVVQTPETHSQSASHDAGGAGALVQSGAHAGGAHRPVLQVPDAQSGLPVQGAPTAHLVGPHDGGWHWSVAQTPETQSQLALHEAGGGGALVHRGAHVGGAHLPALQLPEAQSVAPVQVVSRQTTRTSVTSAPLMMPVPFVTLQTCDGVVGGTETVTS
jgi:hypothetical protein